MTQPSLIYLGSEQSRYRQAAVAPKIYLRSTLFSSGKRGHIVENLFARLSLGETSHSFNVWVYGENDLARGSGLFVGEQGVAYNHHFLLAPSTANWVWHQGHYRLEVFANVIHRSGTVRLLEVQLSVDSHASAGLIQGDCGVFFDWNPDLRHYASHVRAALPPSPQPAS